MLIYLSMIEDAEDQNKFEQVYLRYKNLMFYVAHRILNDAQEAEDAVHDAFVRIAEHIDQAGSHFCAGLCGPVLLGTHDSGCRLPTAGITGGGAGVL